jgi:hypothetical protein
MSKIPYFEMTSLLYNKKGYIQVGIKDQRKTLKVLLQLEKIGIISRGSSSTCTVFHGTTIAISWSASL